jgi:hypothetical protein
LDNVLIRIWRGRNVKILQTRSIKQLSCGFRKVSVTRSLFSLFSLHILGPLISGILSPCIPGFKNTVFVLGISLFHVGSREWNVPPAGAGAALPTLALNWTRATSRCSVHCLRCYMKSSCLLIAPSSLSASILTILTTMRQYR